MSTEVWPRLREDEKELIRVLRRLEGWALVLVHRRRIRQVRSVADENLMWRDATSEMAKEDER